MARPTVLLRPTDVDTGRELEQALLARFAAVRSELEIDGP